MDQVRILTREPLNCCDRFIRLIGQPTAFVRKRFSNAASYTEFIAQEKELQSLLDEERACVHMRDIAVRTHKTLCGNDTHVATAKRAQLFTGVDPLLIEALLGDIAS